MIDTNSHKGKIKTERIGGLFAPRRTALLINGRDQTRLIDGVERQVGYVRDALNGIAHDIEVRVALCFPNVDGHPLFGQLQVRNVIIDGPKPIATLASRPGPLSPDTINRIWQRLGTPFPEAERMQTCSLPSCVGELSLCQDRSEGQHCVRRLDRPGGCWGEDETSDRSG